MCMPVVKTTSAQAMSLCVAERIFFVDEPDFLNGSGQPWRLSKRIPWGGINALTEPISGKA